MYMHLHVNNLTLVQINLNSKRRLTNIFKTGHINLYQYSYIVFYMYDLRDSSFNLNKCTCIKYKQKYFNLKYMYAAWCVRNLTSQDGLFLIKYIHIYIKQKTLTVIYRGLHGINVHLNNYNEKPNQEIIISYYGT